MKRELRSAAVALAAASMLIATAATPALAQAAGGAPERVKIRLGWQKVPMIAANYLMAEAAAKYGLDIELIHFNRYSDMRVALENGSIDFGTVGPGDLALSADSGRSNIVALAGQAIGADLIAKKAGLGKLSWEDVATKGFAFGSFGAGIAWVKTVATLEEKGVGYGRVNEIKIAGTIQDVMQNLKIGKTQVTMNVDPAIAQAVQEGCAEYADELDINQSSLGGQNSLFAANAALLKRPEIVRKVLQNYVDQTRRLQSEPGLWSATYQAYTGIEKAVAETSLQRIKLDLRFSQAELGAFARFLVDKGIARSESLPAKVSDSYVYGPLSDITGRPANDLGKAE
jgi:ABC-type nitrate/sulfonate/bicarbonate transport system substrate-binding protein